MPKRPLPRSVKYLWGLAVSVLLVISLATDQDSKWAPLIHQAIDLLQLQTAPTSNR
jgi:hypothetical protein